MRRSERSKTKSLKAELEDSVQSKCKLLREQRTEKGQGLSETDGETGGREVGAKKGRQETGEEGPKREDSRGKGRAMHEGVLPQKRKQGVGEATVSGTPSSGTMQSKWTALEAAEAVADPDTLLPPSPKKQRQQRSMRRMGQVAGQTAGHSDVRRGEVGKEEGVEREEEGKEKGEGSGDGGGGGGGGGAAGVKIGSAHV